MKSKKFLPNMDTTEYPRKPSFLLFETFQTTNMNYILFHLTLSSYFCMQFTCNRPLSLFLW